MSSGRKPFVLGLVAVVVIAVGVAFLMSFSNGGGSTRLSAKEMKELRETLDVAIARLENFPVGGVEETYQAFEVLRKRFPDERLPRRNETIAKIFALDDEIELTDPKRDEKLLAKRQSAQTACNELMRFESQSPESLWLAVSFLLNANSGVPASSERDQKVVELLKIAEEKDPKNAIYPFAIFGVTENSFDDALRDAEMAPAIKRAYALEPNNAAVLRRYLVSLARQKDPAIKQVLADGRELLMTIRTQVLRDSGSDVGENYEAAIKALDAEEWPQVVRNVQILGNRIKPQEVVKRDESLMRPHVLEFTDYSLSDKVQGDSVTADSLSRVEVSWSAAKAAMSEPALDVQVADFNLDGSMELIVLTPSELRVLAQRDGGWEILASAPVQDGAKGLLISDLDNDNKAEVSDDEASASSAESLKELLEEAAGEGCYVADVDLVVYGDYGAQLFRNVGGVNGASRKLELVAQKDEQWGEVRGVSAAVLADIDHDADLDLVLSTADGLQIWSGQGATSMQYYRLDQFSKLPPKDIVFTSIAAVDWDRDVDLDLLLVSGDGSTRGVMTNLRHARFAWTELDASWSALADAKGIRPAELDGNVSWDAVTAGAKGVSAVLTQTARPGGNRFLKSVEISPSAANDLCVLDFDNDGAADVLAWTENQLQLLRGLGDGSFESAAAQPATKGAIASVRAADVDDDGDLDLVTAGEAGVYVLSNDGGNKNNWIAIRARGRQDNRGRANDSGMGALIELKTGDRYQAQVVDSQVAHFGVGQRADAAVARIVWTNGVPQDIIRPQANTMLCELMVLKGSCPYLYTWNGEEYVFQTDCLWAAPVGLQVAEGVLAPTRPWEYLKIPGENLKPKEGAYEIQLTEELWEIAYFDYVKLIAIDHPASVDVYSNEKVGPPSIAEYTVHTAAEPKLPIRAVDQRGRDLLKTLKVADDRFVKAFDRQIYQGLTPEHYIELDLGKLKQPKEIKLFLRGWLRPTDTSLNVAFSQNPEVDGPKFPSVWTPNEQGEFVEVQPYMGFPGGKTKTIVVDMSDAFATDDYRVRIASTAEIYWDQAFFTVDEPKVELRTTEIEPQTADLHFRGFSKRIVRPHHAPYGYDYNSVTKHPIWPPVEGRFTRFGDVAALVAREDDQLAVLGAGDEMTVRFPALPPVKAGWKRDFFLHCVGWDKDADLNTIHGQSVGPLPLRAMTHYPYDASEAPQDESYRQYLKTYQTRRQNPALFWKRFSSVTSFD